MFFNFARGCFRAAGRNPVFHILQVSRSSRSLMNSYATVYDLIDWYFQAIFRG